MTAKVLIMLGSPRKNGNSAILAQQIAKGAESVKADVETVFLQDLSIAPCKSCYACQAPKSRGCAIQDDMQTLYPKLLAADAWVFASPVYWFTMSAQTKLLMDRCFALPAYGKNPFRGKRISIAMAYGDVDAVRSGCVNALKTFQDAFAFTGSPIIGMVHGSAMEAGQIASNAKLMQEAFELGVKLARG